MSSFKGGQCRSTGGVALKYEKGYEISPLPDQKLLCFTTIVHFKMNGYKIYNIYRLLVISKAEQLSLVYISEEVAFCSLKLIIVKAILHLHT